MYPQLWIKMLFKLLLKFLTYSSQLLLFLQILSLLERIVGECGRELIEADAGEEEDWTDSETRSGLRKLKRNSVIPIQLKEKEEFACESVSGGIPP